MFCAFAGNALHGLWSSTISAWLDRNTNRFILGFAASHTLHLAAIVTLASLIGGHRFVAEFKWTGIILGGLVYLFIYSLALTALLGRRNLALLSSRRFQAVALYAIWFVFATAFVGGTFLQPWPHLPFAVLVLATLFVRIAGNRRARQAASASVG